MSDTIHKRGYWFCEIHLSDPSILADCPWCEIDRLERENKWLRSWHEDVSKALDLPDGGRYRNDAIERIDRLRAVVAGVHEAIGEDAGSDDDSLPNVVRGVLDATITLKSQLERKDKQIAELQQILRERDEEWDRDVGVMRSRIAELEQDKDCLEAELEGPEQ